MKKPYRIYRFESVTLKRVMNTYDSLDDAIKEWKEILKLHPDEGSTREYLFVHHVTTTFIDSNIVAFGKSNGEILLFTQNMKEKITIPEGHQARIEGNNVIIEPKNEDEEVRRWLITLLQNNYKGNYWATQAVEYLEKQKKPKIDIDKLRKDIYQSGYNDGYQHGKDDARKNAQFVNNFF